MCSTLLYCLKGRDTLLHTCQLTLFVPPELFFNKIYHLESSIQHDKFYLKKKYRCQKKRKFAFMLLEKLFHKPVLFHKPDQNNNRTSKKYTRVILILVYEIFPIG